MSIPGRAWLIRAMFRCTCSSHAVRRPAIRHSTVVQAFRCTYSPIGGQSSLLRSALGLHIESTFGNEFFHAEARWLLAWEAQSYRAYVAFEKRSVLPYGNPYPRRIASLVASAVVLSATNKLICRKAYPRIRLAQRSPSICRCTKVSEAGYLDTS